MCTTIGTDGLRRFHELSKERLDRLPDEDAIARVDTRDPVNALAVAYIRQGILAIRQFADCFDGGRLSSEEACVLRVSLVQSELMIGALTAGVSAEAGSCVGTCSDEKSECQDGCEQTFCGCVWDSFLCKSNCFLKVNVGGSIP